MMRSMWSGVTGLQTQQFKMDVIGNNIANVNTVGFKKSNVIFEDLISQIHSIAHGPSDNKGGINGTQVGLGVKVGAVTVNHAQGQFQYTGRNLDVGIEGTGFFILNAGAADNNFYSRAGAFEVDSDGTLVQGSTGYKVQGWSAAPDPTTGEIRIASSTQPIGDIQIRVGDTIPANATSRVEFGGNINSENSIAIDPIVVEYTQDSSSRKVKISFEHAHPTLNYYTWKAEWYQNPPAGSEVADAVIDKNTGIQAQGIIELDDNGKVIGSYKNTDLESSVNYALKTDWNEISDTSSIRLKELISVDSADPDVGTWRVIFDDDQNYRLFYSSDYDRSTGAGQWEARGAGDITSDFESLYGNIVINTSFWAGTADPLGGDTIYFETAKGNANGILDLPSEIPKNQDSWSLLTADVPLADPGNGGQGKLGGVNINSNESDTSASAPDVAGGYTYRNWRVIFTTATDYEVRYDSNYDGTYNSLIGAGVYDPNDMSADFANSTHGIYIPQENWTQGGAPGTQNQGVDITTTAGPGELSNVTVASDAAIDDWTIEFTGANTFTLSNSGGVVAAGLDNTVDNIDIAGSGITINAADWDGAEDATTEITFSTRGDIFDFRVSYSQSKVYNRDFFTVEDTYTRFAFDIDRSGVAGDGDLATVTVDADAVVDDWTITFTDASTYQLSGNVTGFVGTYTTSQNVNVLGLNIQPGYWSGTFAGGDVVTFSTEEITSLIDMVVPSGNTQAETITFNPNTTDTTRNQAAAGNPVTAKMNNVDEYQYATSVNVYDSLGKAHSLNFVFERKSTNLWMWSVMDPSPRDPNNVEIAGYGLLAFNYDGTYDSSTSVTFDSPVGMSSPTSPSNLSKVIFDPPDWGGAPPPDRGAAMVEIDMDFARLVQYASINDGEIYSQDGYGKGTLTTFAINKTGYITGLYDNGQSLDIARLALASFNNPAGLVKTGDSLYRPTGNSGHARIGIPGAAGRGSLMSGSLEMSNVDLAEEFTSMIVTQRGFQANSRTITTVDQMLQELLGLKR